MPYPSESCERSGGNPLDEIELNLRPIVKNRQLRVSAEESTSNRYPYLERVSSSLFTLYTDIVQSRKRQIHKDWTPFPRCFQSIERAIQVVNRFPLIIDGSRFE